MADVCGVCETPDLRAFKSGVLTRVQALAINSDLSVLARFATGLPKAELHLHIEGTFEPELMLLIARRNGLLDDAAWCEQNGYAGDDEAWLVAQRTLRNFNNLEEFLRLYYAGCSVMRTEQDFYDLAWAYLTKAATQGVKRAEMFFDPQTHCVEIQQLDQDVVFNGLHRACLDARAGGNGIAAPVDAQLILCFLRHRWPGSSILEATPSLPRAAPTEALDVFRAAVAAGHANKIIGVGLDSSEAGNPPSLFSKVFAAARAEGLHCVAHAGEEGPAAYITEALDELKVERVDHGVRCLEDPAVVARLVAEQVPLTVCPCSNHRLQVVSRFFGGENPVRQMLDKGLKVTINSDDPAFFFGHKDRFGERHGGYVDSCFVVSSKECGLSADELVKLAINSFESAFLTPEEKASYIAQVKDYCQSFVV